MAVSEKIKLIECPRDAWQGLPGQIPTARKVEYLRALIASGFKHIDAVSFVSPKAVPQMADSEEVLAQLDVPDDVEIIGIVVNERGADRAVATGKVTTLGFPCSVSPTFLRRNQSQSIDENLETLRVIKTRADDAALHVVAYISMAFGNPYADDWSAEKVAELAAVIAAGGVREISLADTTGVAAATRVAELTRSVVQKTTGAELGVHLHSTRAHAAAKILAAYDAGCRRFDSAIGGLGGCPFAQDALVGNIPTEKVVAALFERDVAMPLQLDPLLALNDRISADYA